MCLKDFKELIKKQYNDKGYHGLDFDTYNKEMWAELFKEYKILTKYNSHKSEEEVFDRLIYLEEDKYETYID